RRENESVRKINTTAPARSATIPIRKSNWWAAMLLTVAAAFPLTNRVFGIYIRRSGPRKTRSKYQSPATRPGLLIILLRIEALRVEVMVTSVVGVMDYRLAC